MFKAASYLTLSFLYIHSLASTIYELTFTKRKQKSGMEKWITAAIYCFYTQPTETNYFLMVCNNR
jgi:hypothetical protein